jgi:hypothetical protein
MNINFQISLQMLKISHFSMHKSFNNNIIDWDLKKQCYTLSCIIVLTMGSTYQPTKDNVSYSSYYLLKYTMKCKPHDAIKKN